MKNEYSDPLGQPSRRDFLRIGAATAIAAGMAQLNAQTRRRRCARRRMPPP